jgi:RimJ/RimL family protein N-acetyltransferase
VTLVPEGSPGSRPVQVTALEMLDHDGVRPAREPAGSARMVRSTPPDPQLSRRCYELVGGPWSWVDRLTWSDDDWNAWVGRPGHELWTLHVERELAGYFELSPEPEGVVELAYFGLVPGFEGRGLGGWMLTCALRRAWQVPTTRRVWVHTCDLDGPAALPNYLARGLRVCGSWTEHRLVREDAR